MTSPTEQNVAWMDYANLIAHIVDIGIGRRTQLIEAGFQPEIADVISGNLIIQITDHLINDAK